MKRQDDKTSRLKLAVRDALHLAELFRLADKAGLFRDPEQAAARMKAVLAVRGIAT
jgi:hypothetical protein